MATLKCIGIYCLIVVTTLVLGTAMGVAFGGIVGLGLARHVPGHGAAYIFLGSLFLGSSTGATAGLSSGLVFAICWAVIELAVHFLDYNKNGEVTICAPKRRDR
jgi:hypothetical protein